MLGHRTVVTTQRYALISDDLPMAEAERLDALPEVEVVAGAKKWFGKNKPPFRIAA